LELTSTTPEGSLKIYDTPATVARSRPIMGRGRAGIKRRETYLSHPTVPLGQHTRIITVLGIWALLSAICQRALERARWSRLVPFIWVAADTLCLTAALWLDEAIPGPLIASYPVLVAVSGLWFRVSLVGVTTLLAVLGYTFLIFADFSRYGKVEQMNWHVVFLVLLVLTGCAVAYQVHRVRALSRFYGRPRA